MRKKTVCLVIAALLLVLSLGCQNKAKALADEAAFSDHVLGEAQKKAMTGYVKAARRELEKTVPWYTLWYLRYLLWLW